MKRNIKALLTEYAAQMVQNDGNDVLSGKLIQPYPQQLVIVPAVK